VKFQAVNVRRKLLIEKPKVLPNCPAEEETCYPSKKAPAMIAGAANQASRSYVKTSLGIRALEVTGRHRYYVRIGRPCN